jgi:hypothetical protein
MNPLPQSASATAFLLAPDATSTSGSTFLRPPPLTRQDTHSERLAIRWVIASR